MNGKQVAEQIKSAYHILGLRPGQDIHQIKRAYHALARALHPDLNPRARHSMAAINHAYHTLLDHCKSVKPEPSPGISPLNRWFRRLSLSLAALLGSSPQPPVSAQAPPDSPLPLPAPDSAPLPDSAEPMPAGSGAHWLLRNISREEQKLVYKVEVSGNPKGLALPLRRRRPCRVCQGSGKIWEQGLSQNCGHCAGKGYLIKPVSIAVALPEHWLPGQRLTIAAPSLSVPMEVELHRPGESVALIKREHNS
jgi:hypothetical protein